MNAADFYRQIYDYLDLKTPLLRDCGKICNKACCRGDDPDAGMYLFPREREMYKTLPKWARIEESDFASDGKNVDILICDGTCDRRLRPLSCRIFPLTPYVKDGVLSVIIDPRGKLICPLTSVSDSFFRAVFNVSRLLFKVSETRKFLYSVSEQIDEFENLF